MWVDLFVCAPVTLFMLWLYGYSAPKQRPGWLRKLDSVWMILAIALVVGILVIGHSVSDFEGMGLNVMLVAAAYLSLIGVLGIGWMIRHQARKSA